MSIPSLQKLKRVGHRPTQYHPLLQVAVSLLVKVVGDDDDEKGCTRNAAAIP